MFHSNKIPAQQVVSACNIKGVESVVVSPGSRNAPLIIEFNAYPNIKKYSIVDERSAAFFALGIAKKTKKAVALICSSGSALLNYYPAIAEAYYSEIPLVIISADRPRELLDIGDGQTIRQENVFKNHIQFSANLSEKKPRTNYGLLQEIFKQIKQYRTPIHINVPLSEPLYETTPTLLIDTSQFNVKKTAETLLEETPLAVEELQKYATIWNQSNKKMIVLGEYSPDEMLQTQLDHLVKDPSVIILTENTSNVTNARFVQSIDSMLFPFLEDDFNKYKPEILLTFGGLVISKKIKQLLRDNPPKEHWHIDKNRSLDTYLCLTKHFKVSIGLFFSQFFFLTKRKESSYQNLWIELKKKRRLKHNQFVKNIPFSDFKAFQLINSFIPSKIHIQFSNSSTIRYAQLFSWLKGNKIGCNRGTSGIDGSTSTAIGIATASQQQTLFVTGDLSFFYDSNALWNNYIPNSFRIIVVNNGGGGIFRFIPGPSTSHLLNFFETPHNLKAKQLCEMHQIQYTTAKDTNELEDHLKDFFRESKQPKLLEIFTPKIKNALILKQYFNSLAE